MAKRLILPVENLSEDSRKFLDVLNKSSDLGVVLVATSYLDAAVGALLHKFLIESRVSDKLLDVRGGPLGTFTARSDAAYALALIDKPLYQDLTKIAEIRNAFAHHHLELDFRDSAVASLCSQLKYAEPLFDKAPDLEQVMKQVMTQMRDRFVITVVVISQRLLGNGLGIKRRGETV
jgi:DNA-binding MltR family transcriptional regulator